MFLQKLRINSVIADSFIVCLLAMGQFMYWVTECKMAFYQIHTAISLKPWESSAISG